MSNSTVDIGSGESTESKRSKKLPWRKRLSRFIDRTGNYFGLFGISFSGAGIFSCNHPAVPNGCEIDRTLVVEDLDPNDAPKLHEYRDESLIRARLEKGYTCRVIKNRHGEIDHIAWCTNQPYFCWPVRTVIDPGPHGWYWFDIHTMSHARRLKRFSQNFLIWYDKQPSDMAPVVSAISLWNDAAIQGHLKLGFVEVCRVFCISVFGFKLIRVRRRLPESAVQWLARSRGKNFTYDACTLQIY